MRRALSLAAAFLLSSCTQLPDTVGEAAPDGTLWQLAEVDDTAVAYSATLQLYSSGLVRGAGPCNRFEGRQDAPLPWVAFSALAATKRACPELEAESAYLALLGEMDFAEVQADNMLLTNAAGRSMFFKAR